jgi:hypothetical protein
LKENGDSALSYSGIKTIGISNNVENVRNHCSCWCKSLYEIVFESNSKLKQIDDYTFFNSGIKIIQIPKNVDNIGKKCFCYCESLCELVFESDSKSKEIQLRTISMSQTSKPREATSVATIIPNVAFLNLRRTSLCDVIFKSDSKLKEIDDSGIQESHIREDESFNLHTLATKGRVENKMGNDKTQLKKCPIYNFKTQADERIMTLCG